MHCKSYNNSLYGGIVKHKWQSQRLRKKSKRKKQIKANKHSKRLKLKLYAKITLQEYLNDINVSDHELELINPEDMIYDDITYTNSCSICQEYINIDSLLQLQIFDTIYNLCTNCSVIYDDGIKYHYLYCQHNNNLTKCDCFNKQQFISSNTTTSCMKYICYICQRFYDKMQLFRHKNGEYYICLGCHPSKEWQYKLDVIQFTQCIDCKCWNYRKGWYQYKCCVDKLYECKWKDCINKDISDLCVNHLRCCICRRCHDMIIKDCCICIHCGLLYCNDNGFECGADKRCKNCYINNRNNNFLILIKKVIGNDFFKYVDMIDIILNYCIGYEINCCRCNEIVYGNNYLLGLCGMMNNNEFYFYFIDKDIVIKNGDNYCIYRQIFGQFAVVYCTKCTMNLRPCKACQYNQAIAEYCFNHYYL